VAGRSALAAHSLMRDVTERPLWRAIRLRYALVLVSKMNWARNLVPFSFF
jgi:hypothetical protein